MKAILIVDVDDTKYTHAKVSLSYKDEDGWWADVNYETLPLRPMPLKRKSMVEWVRQDTEYVNPFMDIFTHEQNEYDKGWNDCVDFLEGEENE